MHYLMTRKFSKWAKREGIPVQALAESIMGVAKGQFEENLGGHIYKKRVARTDREKAVVTGP